MEAREQRGSVVASGKTVEDAITNGLSMLGVGRDQVEVEVITEGSRGVLGFGAENARVQLVVIPPPAPQPPPVQVLPPQAPPVQAPAERAPAPPREAEPEGEDEGAEQAGREVLTDILKLMGVQASVEAVVGYELAEEGQPPPIILNITGDDLGILIGRRGETLRALQYLVRLMVSHRVKHWTNIVVDVESYLLRRRRALESLALRVAEQVTRTGRAQALEPMPAYERRMIHVALRKHPKVTTKSVGEGERRKVTIIPRH